MNKRWLGLIGSIACVSAAAVAAQPNPSPSAGTGNNSLIQAANEREALHKAEKAEADAATARYTAEAARNTARIGTISPTTVQDGTITAGTNPGRAEGLLLVTRSYQEAAASIEAGIEQKLRESTRTTILVATSADQLNTADAMMFELRVRRVTMQFAEARRLHQDALSRDVRSNDRERVGAVGTAGAALNSLAALSSFFRTDYGFGEITVAPPSDILAVAVVSRLARSYPDTSFLIASQSVLPRLELLVEALDPLQSHYMEAVQSLEQSTRLAEERRGSAQRNDQQVLAAAQRYDSARVSAANAIKGYDELMAALAAPSATAGTPAWSVSVAKQLALRRILQANPAVLLLVGKEAAAYYTRSNLWTFLGGPPLYTMGGTSSTYTFFHPEDGRVIATGTVAHHGGYMSVERVQRLFGVRR